MTPRKAFCALVLTEEHLPAKWVREVRDTIPAAFAQAGFRVKDVDGFVRHAQHLPHQTMGVFIIPKSMAKLGSGWTGAYQPGRLSGRPLFRCPTCGQPVTEVDEEGNPSYLIQDPAWFGQRKRRCPTCGGALWQMVRMKGGQPHFPEPLRLQGTLVSNPPEVRYALADYIRKRYPGFFDLLIVDEAHRYNGQGTDQTFAYLSLVKATRGRVLELTASTFNGTASSLFNRLFTLNPHIRARFAWGERQRFVQRYGRLQITMKEKDGDHGYGVYSGRRRRVVNVKELPAVSPEIVVELLKSHVFMRLEDLGAPLPDLVEEACPIHVPPELLKPYERFSEACIEALTAKLPIAGAWLQACLAWPNAPWNTEVVRYTLKDEEGKPLVGGHGQPLTAEVARLEPLWSGHTDPRLLPKEEWLLETVSEHTEGGRGVGIYLQHIHERGLPERILWLMAQAGVRAAVMPESIESRRREAWIREAVGKGTNVLITHPGKVETGLDLYAFPTLIFYQMPYNLVQLLQAKGRAYRLGQTEDCQVLFPYYRHVMEHRALELMAKKLIANQILTGAEDAVAVADEVDSAGEFLAELAKSAVQNSQIEDLGTLMRQQNRQAWEEADDLSPLPRAPAPLVHRGATQLILL